MNNLIFVKSVVKQQVYNYNKSVAVALKAIEYYDIISVGRIVSSELSLYRLISGAFGAFRKDAIDKIGGGVGPWMDGDISVKLKKMGCKIKFEPAEFARSYSVAYLTALLIQFRITIEHIIFLLFRCIYGIRESFFAVFKTLVLILYIFY